MRQDTQKSGNHGGPTEELDHGLSQETLLSAP